MVDILQLAHLMERIVCYEIILCNIVMCEPVNLSVKLLCNAVIRELVNSAVIYGVM
jgi:hypothetical protein